VKGEGATVEKEKIQKKGDQSQNKKKNHSKDKASEEKHKKHD